MRQHLQQENILQKPHFREQYSQEQYLELIKHIQSFENNRDSHLLMAGVSPQKMVAVPNNVSIE